MAELFLVVYLGSLVATPIIASNKKRNPLGWFLLALLLGVIAVIIVALMSPKQAGSAGQGVSAAHMRPCPHCLSSIPMQASVCSVCKRDVPRIDPFEKLRGAATSLRYDQCPECAGRVGATALGCSHCGANLAPYRQALQNAAPPKSLDRPQA